MVAVAVSWPETIEAVPFDVVGVAPSETTMVSGESVASSSVRRHSEGQRGRRARPAREGQLAGHCRQSARARGPSSVMASSIAVASAGE